MIIIYKYCKIISEDGKKLFDKNNLGGLGLSTILVENILKLLSYFFIRRCL